MTQAGNRSRRRLRGAVAGILLVFAGAAGEAWQVELVSRVHPDRLSETGAGAVPDELGFEGELPPSVSADGRYAVFVSPATNLVPGQKDSNAIPNNFVSGEDVFLRDLLTGTTTLVSHAPGSPETADAGRSSEAVVSADGRWVAFNRFVTHTATVPTGSFTFVVPDLYLYDRAAGTTTLVSPGPLQPSSTFSELALSADGRYLAFVSDEHSLVPGQVSAPPGSSLSSVFFYDRVEGTMRLVSHASSSLVTEAGGKSPAISADGRYVAFLSDSGDLVPGEEPGPGAFLYDRVSQTVRRIGPGNARVALSADGRYAAVAAEATTYLWDRETGTQTVLSEEAGISNAEGVPVAISADGRYVAFTAWDDLLVPGQQGDVHQRLFLYDRISGSILLAGRREDSPSVPADGTAAPSLSADGRHLAYMRSDDGFSWDVFLFDRVSGTTRLLSEVQGSPTDAGDFSSFLPVVSADGSAVLFWSGEDDLVAGLEDGNQGQDVFLYETGTGERSAVSVRAPELPSRSPGSRSAAGSLSADGRWIAFESDSPSLLPGQVDTNGERDVFLYDRATKTTVLVSRSSRSTALQSGDGSSIRPVVSADGRYVVFDSKARDLVAGAFPEDGTFDVYLFDRVTGTTRLVGRTEVTEAPGSASPFFTKEMTPDGRWVVFTSNADGLVPGQQEQRPGTFDVFLWDRVTGSTVLASRSSAGPAVAGDGSSFVPMVSADGRYVAFLSVSGDLVPGQIDEGERDLFLFDRRTGRTSLVSHAPGSAVTATGPVDVPSISADGRWILYRSLSGDVVPGGEDGLFLYDRTRRTSERIAAGTDGRISADGKAIAVLDFFGQIYHFDRISGASTLVTRHYPPGDQPSFSKAWDPSISATGRYIAYSSEATDLVPGLVPEPGRKGMDVYLYDRVANASVLASRGPASPLSAPGFSEGPILSADGRHVAFSSFSPLAADDLNLRLDAYLFTAPATVSVPACKLFDTRRRQDRPVLRTGLRRVVKAHGACGVPATAKSVLVKVTVANPSGRGNLRFYPGDSTSTLVPAALLRFAHGQTRSEIFTIPLATNGTGTFAILPQVAGNGTVHVTVEVSGYVE